MHFKMVLKKKKKKNLGSLKLRSGEDSKGESDEAEMKDSRVNMERGRATAEPHENYASHGAGRGSTDGVPRLAC